MPSRTHILDFLLLLVTFLCIIHSHSSKSDRHPPIRNTLTLSISHLVSTRTPSHLSAQHPSKTHNKLYICLLLFMHDIELNPGPRSPKFPCGICHKAVTSNQCGVASDTCNIWHHTTCIHMSSNTYESLHNISWHCTSGSVPQLTTSLPNSPTSINNPFSSHDISTSQSNNILVSQPTTTVQRQAHKPLKIININFQSVKNKTAELGNFISVSDPDILIGTETWLNQTITDMKCSHQATHFYEKTDKMGIWGEGYY